MSTSIHSRSCLFRHLVAGLALLAVTSSFGSSGGVEPSGRSAGHTVRLIVNYNDGVEKHFTAIPWHRDMTVLDALNHSKKGSHGITFEYKGSGETALLSRIDDLQNQGGGRGKKNWLYWVNTDFADRSLGIRRLQPSDVVLWRYDVWSDQ